MRRLSIASSIAAGILALAPFSAALAAQAPQYTSSDPANGAELHKAPESVSVTFTEPLDADSVLKVFACGKRVDAGDSAVTLNEVEVALASGPTGKYEARWVAIGFAGITGSSEGSIEFTVGHGDVSCAGSGHGSGHGSGKGSGNGGSGHGSGHQGSGQEGSGGHQGSSHESGSGSTHSGTSHTSGSTSLSGGGHSASGSGHSGSNHGNGQSKSGGDEGHGSGHGGQPEDAAGNPNFAANGGPLPIPTPEAGAVLLALFACVGLGITGGWLARLV